MIPLVTVKPMPRANSPLPQTMALLNASAENVLGVDENKPSEKKIEPRFKPPRSSLPNSRTYPPPGPPDNPATSTKMPAPSAVLVSLADTTLYAA